MTTIKAVYCTILALLWRMNHPFASEFEWQAYIAALIERHG